MGLWGLADDGAASRGPRLRVRLQALRDRRQKWRAPLHLHPRPCWGLGPREPRLIVFLIISIFTFRKLAGGEFVFSELERQHVAVGRVYFTVVPRDRLRDLEVVLLVEVDGVVVVRLDVEVDLRCLVLLAGLRESVVEEPPPNPLATVRG